MVSEHYFPLRGTRASDFRSGVGNVQMNLIHLAPESKKVIRDYWSHNKMT